MILVGTTAAQQVNGVTATEGTTYTSPGGSIDALWADSTALRWMVNNHSSGSQPLSVWACPTQGGGIVYSGAAPSGSSTNAESCLGLSTHTGVPLITAPGAVPPAPAWGGNYLNLQTNPMVSELSNNSSGTTQYKLVVLATAGGSQVQTPTTFVTQGVEGICADGCGTSGTSATAQIARSGITLCTFDGGTNPGEYVQISGTVLGDCHSTGSTTYPSNGQQVLGRAVTTHGTGGNWLMMLYPSGIVPPNQGSACSSQVVTALNNVSGPTCTTIDSSYVNTSSIATTAFVKSAIFATWASQATTLTNTNPYAYWTVPAAIYGTGLDVALIQAPSGCSQYGTLAVYDNNTGSAILSVPFATGTSTYTNTGHVSISSGDVLRVKMTTAASCSGGTAPANALVTFTYQMQ